MNPRVAEAIARQLQSPDQSVSDKLAQRLAAIMPGGLSACYFLNSLSEANEMALRLARAHVTGKDVIVLEGADHGMTTSLKNMSPARGPVKFWAHIARRGNAEDVEEKVRTIQASGRGVCGYFADGPLSQEFLTATYAIVREAGGLCVSTWVIGEQRVVPDVAVLDESLAGGLPFAAVITRPELAVIPLERGHPAMCAAALATLDLIQGP